MKVLFLDVNKGFPPKLMDIEDNLETFYRLINCRTIDIVIRSCYGRAFNVICDDEGLFTESPLVSAVGRYSLVGNLIFTGLADEDGNLTDLAPETITAIILSMVSIPHPQKGKPHIAIRLDS